MLQVTFIKDNKEKVIAGLRKRNWSPERIAVIDQILALDDTRKATQKKVDDAQAEVNSLSKQVGALMKAGKADEATAAKTTVATRKAEITQLDAAMTKYKDDLEQLLLGVPNIPHASVPHGKGADDNEVYKMGIIPIPTLDENALPHWELAEKYNIFDLKLGVKITGAGFPVFRGKGARLQRALINMFLDEATKAGYEEIVPPLMVNGDTARGTGQLPDKEAQMYYIERDDFYLIPTAEVPVTNILRDVIVEEKDLPIKFTSYTPCFRREAGSYGADVKGLNRVHQFDKIEIIQAQHPDKSYETLMEMVAHVERLLIKLNLPYRILRLCGGDMGFTSALTFDFEVYSAAQKRWLEVSSVSNFETFQSNRMKIRFRDADKKMTLVHTLNGSALALARIIAALLENNQSKHGIYMPDALQKYLGFEIINALK
jgi:seryl-tRNA synthetase